MCIRLHMTVYRYVGVSEVVHLCGCALACMCIITEVCVFVSICMCRYMCPHICVYMYICRLYVCVDV